MGRFTQSGAFGSVKRQLLVDFAPINCFKSSTNRRPSSFFLLKSKTPSLLGNSSKAVLNRWLVPLICGTPEIGGNLRFPLRKRTSLFLKMGVVKEKKTSLVASEKCNVCFLKRHGLFQWLKKRCHTDRRHTKKCNINMAKPKQGTTAVMPRPPKTAYLVPLAKFFLWCCRCLSSFHEGRCIAHCPEGPENPGVSGKMKR